MLFNNPVYFFTDKDVVKKELFGHEKVVLVYNDVDHYYLVHADYTNNGIGTPKKDIPFRIASEYWFMKGDEVVSTIGSDFQNIQEALKMIPSYFAGEIQLSREQSVKRDIRGVKTKEELKNLDYESLGKDVYVVARSNLKPGCLFKLVLLFFCPVLLSGVAQFISGENWGDNSSLVLVFLFSLFFVLLLLMYVKGKKKGWLTIDEKNGVFDLGSLGKPLRKNKILPINQMVHVEIDRKKNVTTVYDENGAWCEIIHQRTPNYHEVYEALYVLAAKGKIKLKETETEH